MNSPEREIDPMALLRRASGEEPVPEEKRARVRAAVASALQASGAGMPAASAARAEPGGAKDVANTANPGPLATMPNDKSGLRLLATRFLHWSAPALVIGAAAGVTAQREIAKAASQRNHVIAAAANVTSLPSSAAAPAAATNEANAASKATETNTGATSALGTEAQTVIAPSGEPAASAKLVGGAGELAREHAVLEQARGRLAAGEPARALDLVARHERRHAQGALSEEREALAVNALVSLGRYRDALQRGEAFRNRYPQSLLMPSVEAALAAIPGR